jgi:hypothetical protein
MVKCKRTKGWDGGDTTLRRIQPSASMKLSVREASLIGLSNCMSN